MVGGAVLHHVTMSYDIDADKMLEVLRIGREKLSRQGHGEREQAGRPGALADPLPREAVIDAFAAHFRSRYPTVDGELRPDELARAAELMRTKFTDPAWTARVP